MTRLQPLLTWRSAIVDSELTPPQRHVALTLSLHMSERGDSAFPGARVLALETGLAERTVRAALKALVTARYLEVVEQGGIKGKKRRANHYQAGTPAGGAGVPVPPAVAPTPATHSGVQAGTPAGAAGVPLQETALTPAGGSPQLFIEHSMSEDKTPSLRSGAPPAPRTEAECIIDEIAATDRVDDRFVRLRLLDLGWAESESRPWRFTTPIGTVDLLWEALVRVTGVDPAELTTKGRKSFNTALEELRPVASPAEMIRRARRYFHTFRRRPPAHDLSKRWAELGDASEDTITVGALRAQSSKDLVDRALAGTG